MNQLPPGAQALGPTLIRQEIPDWVSGQSLSVSIGFRMNHIRG